MTILSLSYWAYAVVLLLGGLLGYLRARSNASLIAGILFAVLAAISGLLVHSSSPGGNPDGIWLGGITALVVSIFFAGRYHATKKPMPAIPIIFLSILVIVFSAVSLLGHRVA